MAFGFHHAGLRSLSSTDNIADNWSLRKKGQDLLRKMVNGISAKEVQSQQNVFEKGIVIPELGSEQIDLCNVIFFTKLFAKDEIMQFLR